MSWIAVGSLVACAGVAAGAFGAHGLKAMLSAARLETFEVAVRYQMYHGIALILAGMLGADRAAWCFLLGVLVFSGSLYLLVLTESRWLGAITPIGGLLLLTGWAFLAFGYKR